VERPLAGLLRARLAPPLMINLRRGPDTRDEKPRVRVPGQTHEQSEINRPSP
jgi:hypothetical protein